jgi:hypothetical protein
MQLTADNSATDTVLLNDVWIMSKLVFSITSCSYGCESWSMTLQKEHRLKVRFQDLTVMGMKMLASCDIVLCSPIEVD